MKKKTEKTVDMYRPRDRAEAGKIFLMLKGAFGDQYETYSTDSETVMYPNQEVVWSFDMSGGGRKRKINPYLDGEIAVCLYSKNSGKPSMLGVHINLGVCADGDANSEDFSLSWSGNSAAKFLTAFKRARRDYKEHMAALNKHRDQVARVEQDMAARMGVVVYGAEEAEREYDGSELPPRRPYDPRTITFGRHVIKRGGQNPKAKKRTQ